jgi:hypothetical protein
VKPLTRALILAALLPALSAAGYQRAARPADDLPTTHWAYDAVQSLAQLGVPTGFPDGTFQGKRPLTRGDFAQVIHRIYADTILRAGEGPRYTPQWLPQIDRNLQLLGQEFAPELEARGLSHDAVEQGRAMVASVWNDPSPRGVTAPLPGVGENASMLVWPADPEWQAVGERAAREEVRDWKPCLWGLDPNSRFPETPNAIPLRPAPAGEDERERIQLMLGHNRAIWKELARPRSPYRLRWPWTADLFNLRFAWQMKSPGARELGSAALALDGHRLQSRGAFDKIVLDGLARDLPFGGGKAALCDAGSEVALIAERDPPVWYYALDLRTGTVLAALRVERKGR